MGIRIGDCLTWSVSLDQLDLLSFTQPLLAWQAQENKGKKVKHSEHLYSLLILFFPTLGRLLSSGTCFYIFVQTTTLFMSSQVFRQCPTLCWNFILDNSGDNVII